MGKKRLHHLLLLAAAVLGAGGCEGGRGGDESVLSFRIVDAGRVAGCRAADRPPPPALAFFVSEVSIVDADGRRIPAPLPDSPPWQSAGVALIRPAGPGCDDTGSNAELRIPAVTRMPRGIEFTVGVPRSLNHGDPLRAEAPLSDMRMHWSWRSGYKFLRLDAADGRGVALTLHVGATGCRSPAPVRPPAAACDRPNRMLVSLPYAGGDAHIDFDVAGLAAAVGGAPAHCVGAYHEDTLCSALLARLGLDAVTGQCVDGCRGQTVFRTGAPP